MAKKRGVIPEEFKVKLQYIILALIIILIICLFIYYPKNCGKDSDCFIKKAQSCSRAKVIDYKEGNEFIYEIKAKSGSDCIFSVKMSKMKENTDYNLVKLLEGKEMLCQIPLEEFKKNPLASTKSILGKCSGPMKEALQQLTIERLYSVVVSNIGGINEELQDLIG